MTNQIISPERETKQQSFERLLAREPFKGLKAILDHLSSNREALCEAAIGALSYEDLLAKLGYRIHLERQIHVQDAFSRVGPAGGIKAVLPYYDIPTQGSFPTLIHFDSSVTLTAKSAAFFNRMLTALKMQLKAQG